MNSAKLDSRALNNFTNLSNDKLEEVNGGMWQVAVVMGIGVIYYITRRFRGKF